MTYKFIGQMNCDKCKFLPDCKVGEDDCPYLTGWQDGQAKLQRWLHEPCEEHSTLRGFGNALLRKDCLQCQKELRLIPPVSPKRGL